MHKLAVTAKHFFVIDKIFVLCYYTYKDKINKRKVCTMVEILLLVTELVALVQLIAVTEKKNSSFLMQFTSAAILIMTNAIANIIL